MNLTNLSRGQGRKRDIVTYADEIAPCVKVWLDGQDVTPKGCLVADAKHGFAVFYEGVRGGDDRIWIAFGKVEIEVQE